MPTRHKHADLIIAWANGAIIEYRTAGAADLWKEVPDPAWYPNSEYRIKPKPKVKKYKWVYTDRYGGIGITGDFHKSDDSYFFNSGGRKAIQRIDSLFIEVEE